MNLPILVLKFGTASITKPSGDLDEPVLIEIARQVAQVQNRYRVVLVSSGAVGAGRAFLKQYRGELSERKAAAAIGNPLLLSRYATYFNAYGIPVAQSLCERGHFANRSQFLQLKQTYETLWDNGVIPIANENDVVSNLELKFSDNDELATLLATGLGAETLLFSTSVGGLLDESGQIVPRVEHVDAGVLGLAKTDKSALGLGGMTSKLSFAKRATRLGIRVVIFGMKTPDGILKALREETGTVFPPEPGSFNSRQRWLGSGGLVVGKVEIDAGAVRALQARRSLLAVGVRALTGEFDRGEVIEILDEEQQLVAVAKARESSRTLATQLRTPNVEVAHADDIVLL